MNNMKYSLIIFLIFIFAFACNENNNIDICSGYKNVVYRYPEYQCKESDSINCYQEKVKSLLLPKQYLHCSSTDSLIRTCLAYPLLSNIWFYSTLQQGYDNITKIFNGFDELFNRTDVNVSLINVYSKMDPDDVNLISDVTEKGMLMTQFTIIEISMAQIQFINKLSSEENDTLLSICLKQYYAKSSIPSFSYVGEMSILAIMSRILYFVDYDPFMQGLLNIPNLQYFIDSADLVGVSNIEEISNFIINNTNNFLNE